MKDNIIVFAKLLCRAYRYEDAEQEIISQALLQITNTSLWDVMFSIMKDNEFHKKMLEQVVETMGVNLEDFREYSFRNIQIATFNFTDDLAVGVLNELLKYECWAKNYYEHTLNIIDPMLSKEVDMETLVKVKEILKQLAEWENIHIEKIKDVMGKI